MFDYIVVGLLTIPVLAYSSFSALAQDVIKGKIQAIDKRARRVTIHGTDYSLGADAPLGKITVGDDVEAVVMGGTIRGIVKR